MKYQTKTDRVGSDVQVYEAEDMEDALEKLRQDLRYLEEQEPAFSGLAEEADESWLEEA